MVHEKKESRKKMNWKQEYYKSLSDIHAELMAARAKQIADYISSKGMVTIKEVKTNFGIKADGTLRRIRQIYPEIRELYLTTTGGAKVWKNGKIIGGEGVRLSQMGLAGIRWLYVDVNDNMCKRFRRLNKKKKLDRIDRSTLTRTLNASGLLREETRRLVYGD